MADKKLVAAAKAVQWLLDPTSADGIDFTFIARVAIRAYLAECPDVDIVPQVNTAYPSKAIWCGFGLPPVGTYHLAQMPAPVERKDGGGE